jgi:hypothetical protein
VQALRDDAKGWMEQWFKDIRPWSPKEIDITRVAWLRVYGIPHMLGMISYFPNWSTVGCLFEF